MIYKFLSRKQKSDIAIDLGTANRRIITAADGIVFDEPSLCCLVEQMIANVGATASIDIKGQNMTTGLPEARSIPVEELAVLVGKHIDAIADMSANLLGNTAPELCDDIHSNGIILTGGSAAINLIGQTPRDKIGVPATVADQSKSCVAHGLHSLLLH